MAYLVLTNVYLEARGVTFPAASHTQGTIVYDFSSAPEITRRWPMRWRCSGICREAREGTQLQPALYERVLATCRSVANVRAQANALLGLGQVAYELGDWNRTKAWANQTLEFALDHGFKSIAVAGMHLLGIVDEHEHRMSAAYDRLSECDALARSMGPRGRWWVVMGLPALARVVGAQGDLVQASRLGAETAMLARGLGDLQAIARALESCAWVASEAGHYKRALRLAGAATTIRDRTRAAMGASDRRLTSQPEKGDRAMTRAATNDPTCVLDAHVRLRQPLHMPARRFTEFEYDQ